MSHAVDLDALLRELEEADRNGEGEWSVQLHLAHSAANLQATDPSTDGQHDADMTGTATVSSAQYVQFIRELEHQLKSAQHSSATNSGSASSNLLQVSSATSIKQQQHQQQKQLFTLRKSLRSAYLEFIHTYFMDASTLDLESSLWKQTVHKQIEAFRFILKQSTPQPSSKKCAQQWKRYQQFHTLTRSFLKECMRLYERLFFKHLVFTGWEAVPITSKSKLTTAKLEHSANPATSSQDSPASEGRVSELHLPRLSLRPLLASAAASSTSSASVVLLPYETRSLYLQSCHRCLLFRGDLERYDQLIQQDMETQRNKLKQIPALAALLFNPSPTSANRNITASSSSEAASSSFIPNWRRCERFYELAVVLLPELGNPWNQLAVLATYQDDPLLAVYRYIRAVACINAFPTAEVNLKLLFGNSVSNHVYQQHARSFSETNAGPPLLTTLFPGVRVCALDFTWMHVFHLLSQIPTDPDFVRMHLPCAVFSALAWYNNMLSSVSSGSPNDRSKIAFQILISLLHFFHRYHSQTQMIVFEPHTHANPGAENGTPHHLRQQDTNSMYDEEVLSTKGAYSCTASDAILAICVEFLSITITSIHSPKSPFIGVIHIFLVWMQRQKRAIGSVDNLQSILKPILQAFLHNLASLANICAAHTQLALSNPPKVDVSEPDELMENEAIKGLAFMMNSASVAADRDSNAMDVSGEDIIDAKLHVAEASDASVRRCMQLVSGADFLARCKIGLVKEELRVSPVQSPVSFRYRSLLDEEAPKESMAAEVLSPSNARRPSAAHSTVSPPSQTMIPTAAVLTDRLVLPAKTVSSPARKQAPIGPSATQSRSANGTPPHQQQQSSVGFQMARAFGRASASLFSDSLTSPPIDRHIPGAVQLPPSNPPSSNDRIHRPPPGFQPLPIDTIRWANPSANSKESKK